MILLGATLIQVSASIVMPLIKQIGGAAASGWRFLLGAVVLLLVFRPRVRTWSRDRWVGAVLFGLAAAVMNQAFFQAIDRLNLGTAVAIEYLGPFLVAALGRKSWRHGLFVLLAALGVMALTRPFGVAPSITGILFAALAGAGWAGYAFASHRVGGDSAGFDGLTVSMCFGAVFTLPMTISSVPVMTAHPSMLLRMLVVAVMATALGFGAEMQALRILPPVLASVLLALDPAVALVVGLVGLHQRVVLWDALGILLVVLAGIGVTMDAAEQSREPAK